MKIYSTDTDTAKITLLVSLLAYDRELLYPYGGKAVMLAASALFRCAGTVKIAEADYPVVCTRCAKAIGSSSIRAMYVSDVQHTGCYNVRKSLVWHNANLDKLAFAIGTSLHVLEHFMVLEELARTKQYERQLDGLSRYSTIKAIVPGFEAINGLS